SALACTRDLCPSYRVHPSFPLACPVAHDAGRGEVAEVEVTEWVDPIADLVEHWALRRYGYHRETGSGPGVFAVQCLGAGHPELFGALNPALDLDVYQV